METTFDDSAPKLHSDSTPQHGARERWRKRLSFAVIVSVIMAIPLFRPTRAEIFRNAESIVGLSFVVIAVLGRLWCSTYIAGRKNAELCTVGPYSLVRHPLYVFSSFGFLGVLLATHRPLLAAGGFGLFWAYYIYVMREEDRRLSGIFGGEFAAYSREVSNVWPDFRRFRDVPGLNVVMRPLHRAFLDALWFFVAWIVVCAICG